MKNILLTAVLAVFLTPFFVPCAEGQQNNVVGPPPSLPASLPIGSTNAMISWIVTNRPCNVSFKLTFASATNSNEAYIAYSFGTVQFASLASFEACMISNYWSLYTNDIVKRNDIISPIGVSAVVTSPGIADEGLIIQTNNIGVVGQISSNSFADLTAAAYNRIRPSIVIPGLSLFSVVCTNPSYSYTWTLTNQSPQNSNYQAEWTTNGVVILNPWYGCGMADVRITIAVGGQTNIYTSFGALLAMPTGVMLPKASLLTIAMTPGSDVIVKTSANPNAPFTSWTTLTNLPWSLDTSIVRIPIKLNQQPRAFYAIYNQAL